LVRFSHQNESKGLHFGASKNAMNFREQIE